MKVTIVIVAHHVAPSIPPQENHLLRGEESTELGVKFMQIANHLEKYQTWSDQMHCNTLIRQTKKKTKPEKVWGNLF